MGYWVKTAFQGVASAAARRISSNGVLYYIIISLEFQVIQA